MATLSWMCIAVMLIVSLTKIPTATNAGKGKGKTIPRARNCLDVPKKKSSGIYTIYPYDSTPDRPVKVYCDMDTAGGGWTVIQRRDDIEPREDFYRTWMEYSKGFGHLQGEFWLGLDHIHALTDQTLYNIRFDLADFENNTRWAEYKFFYVHDRNLSYKMEVNGYSVNGDAGDSFSYHNGFRFSTKDMDLDIDSSRDCAEVYKGAWWYKRCLNSNLNGQYLAGEHSSVADGVYWYNWHGYYYSLKKTEIKIRPAY